MLGQAHPAERVEDQQTAGGRCEERCRGQQNSVGETEKEGVEEKAELEGAECEQKQLQIGDTALNRFLP